MGSYYKMGTTTPSLSWFLDLFRRIWARSLAYWYRFCLMQLDPDFCKNQVIFGGPPQKIKKIQKVKSIYLGG